MHTVPNLIVSMLVFYSCIVHRTEPLAYYTLYYSRSVCRDVEVVLGRYNRFYDTYWDKWGFRIINFRRFVFLIRHHTECRYIKQLIF